MKLAAGECCTQQFGAMIVGNQLSYGTTFILLSKDIVCSVNAEGLQLSGASFLIGVAALVFSVLGLLFGLFSLLFC